MFIELDNPSLLTGEQAILEDLFRDALGRVLGRSRHLANLEFYHLQSGRPVHVVRVHLPELSSEDREALTWELAETAAGCPDLGLSMPVLVSLEEVPPESGYRVPLRQVKLRW